MKIIKYLQDSESDYSLQEVYKSRFLLAIYFQTISTGILRVLEPEQMKEGNVLFNDILNTLYLWLYGVRHMVKDHSDSERGEREREMFYLTTHSTHFIYSYMASYIW